jgi:hypothetical protein
MSYDLITASVPIDPASLPPNGLGSPDALMEQLDIGTGARELLMARSRNGWLLWAMQRVAENYDLPALSLFRGKPWESDGNMVGTLLRGPEIAAVVDAIDALFDAIRSDPDAFVAIDSALGCCATDVLEAIDGATVSLDPMIDDGDQIESVFNLLRSFQAQCRVIQDSGRHVLFVQMC